MRLFFIQSFFRLLYRIVCINVLTPFPVILLQSIELFSGILERILLILGMKEWVLTFVESFRNDVFCPVK